MKPFLKQIAELFHDKHGADIHRLAFVFPNRRSGVFFRKYLSETASKPIFSPTILTIDELFRKLNPKQPVDPVKALFILYHIYIRQSGLAETFDDFVYWGKMLLNDFDEIDKYLVDARQLFTNVTDLMSIEKDFSFLQPSQVQSIRSFWSTFQPESGHSFSSTLQPESADRNRQFFLHVWELLYPIYKELHKTLIAEGIATEGKIYREVVESFEKIAVTNILPYEKIVFVGLNALTKSERELLKLLKENHVADFYWDYASEKVCDGANKASFFMKDNISMFPSAYPLPEEDTVDTQFELIGIPSHIGQAKQLYPILADSAKGILPEKVLMTTSRKALQTAIVLPDEQLLIPVLHSIPEYVSQINVTLGYPLSGTLVASLMDCLQSLQKTQRKIQHETLYYHSDVKAVLQHAYVSSVCPEEAASIVQDITTRNQVYIPESSLCTTPFLKILFTAPVSAIELSGYLIDILKELNIKLSIPESDAGAFAEESENNEAPIHMFALECEFIYHYYTIVNRMREMIRETQTVMSTETFFRLLKQMTDFIKIPFHGEPLSGLQVMGVLETRVLDFDNIIILSVNEGVFPAKSINSSFIPYHLRHGFGLPVPEHQDSIRAYHFYRMIHRAQRVVMLYDTRTDGLQSGEPSRFIHQLQYHYKTPVRQALAVYNISSSRAEPFRVDKDDEIMRSLALYETEKSLSASAINTYIDCPVKFYFTAIKGIDEEKMVSETLRHDMFGTLLHRVMELAFKPFCGKTVTADLLKSVVQEKNMTELIQLAFAGHYFHSDEPRPLTGQSFLYGEMIRKYACKILEHDRSLTPFQYTGSEKLFHRTLKITDGRMIRIKGFIDRIDRVNGTWRIVDYKSGKPSALTFSSMENLFDIAEKDRKKAIMQIFLYAWEFALETGEKQIQPAVYYANNLFRQSTFESTVYQIVEKEKRVIDHFGDEYPLFEDSLRTCLNNLFDPDKPFTQTSVAKQCKYCIFGSLCSR